MTNNYIDCSYIALELVKLYIQSAQEIEKVYYKREAIVKMYMDNLEELTGLKNLENIDNLVAENEKLREENKKMTQKSVSYITTEDIKNIIKYVSDNSMNMEPYISSYLQKELKKYL